MTYEFAFGSAVMTRRSVLAGLGVVGGAVVLAGCGFSGSGTSDGASPTPGGLAANQTLRIPIATASIDSFDPHFVNGGSYLSPKGLLEGLIAIDEAGTGVVPAIAESWDISSDGKTYTFHLRDNAKFSNGDPITADDFVKTYQRLLSPTAAGTGSTNGANSYKPGLGIVGATAFLAGSSTDWSTVGIVAEDPSTLVITLGVPNATFLMGLADVSMLVLHMPTLEKFPNDWMQPANWVGSGPYVLTEWVPTSSVTMKKHDQYWDKDNVFIETVNARITSDGNALLLAYRNDELDVTTADMNIVGGDPTLGEQLITAPAYSMNFMQTMFSQHPASRDARVRRALSMAIDRDAIAKINVGSEPGIALVPSTVPGWDPSLKISYDLDAAKKLLADAGYANGKGMPKIQILSPVDLPIYQAVMQMWQDDLGLQLEYNVVDFGQFAATRYVPLEDPNMWGFNVNSFGGMPTWTGWVQNIWGPDVIPFFSLPADKASEYLTIQADKEMPAADKAAQMKAITDQYGSPEANKFAADVLTAAAIPEDDKRTAAFLQAALDRQQLGYQIPLCWNGINYLVKPNVAGVHLHYLPTNYYLKGVYISQ